MNTSQLAYLAHLIGPIKTHQASHLQPLKFPPLVLYSFSEPRWENSYQTDLLKRFLRSHVYIYKPCNLCVLIYFNTNEVNKSGAPLGKEKPKHSPGRPQAPGGGHWSRGPWVPRLHSGLGSLVFTRPVPWPQGALPSAPLGEQAKMLGTCNS